MWAVAEEDAFIVSLFFQLAGRNFMHFWPWVPCRERNQQQDEEEKKQEEFSEVANGTQNQQKPEPKWKSDPLKQYQPPPGTGQGRSTEGVLTMAIERPAFRSFRYGSLSALTALQPFMCFHWQRQRLPRHEIRDDSG